METEADICKRTGMLTNMIWQLPQITPLSYLVIFQVAPEPRGGVTMGAGRPPEIMQVHSSFGHSYIICLQVQISQHYCRRLYSPLEEEDGCIVKVGNITAHHLIMKLSLKFEPYAPSPLSFPRCLSA